MCRFSSCKVCKPLVTGKEAPVFRLSLRFGADPRRRETLQVGVSLGWDEVNLNMAGHRGACHEFYDSSRLMNEVTSVAVIFTGSRFSP